MSATAPVCVCVHTYTSLWGPKIQLLEYLWGPNARQTAFEGMFEAEIVVLAAGSQLGYG